MAGPLSSVMMIATAGLLPSGANDPQIGASLDVSANLVAVLDDYDSLPVIQQFTEIVTAAGGNVLTANSVVPAELDRPQGVGAGLQESFSWPLGGR